MASHFHTLRVKDIRRETPDCISIAFDVPENLKEIFRFSQGQNLTLRTVIKGTDIRRSYSICSATFENELRVAVKKVEGGLFSTWANEVLRKGDAVELLPPSGKFNTPLHPEQHRQYLAIAAGSGITPIISIVKTTLREEPFSRFTLVYGNRSRSHIIFFEELEALKNKYLQRFQFINVLSREKTDAPLHSGRIDLNKLQELGRLINYPVMDETFLCGPAEMIFCAKEFLEARGVDKKKIHFELFSTPGGTQTERRRVESAAADGRKSNIEVKVDGRSFQFDLPFNSDFSILDAALKQGADLPFACKGGVCCTCKAKLLEGGVDMDVSWGLEQEEIDQGYVLTCQSHPKTERVVVDFDIK